MNKAEEEIMNLDPDQTIFLKVDMDEFDTELEKCSIRCRWEARKEQSKYEQKKVEEDAPEPIQTKL